MSVAVCSGGVSEGYSGALDHYLSPARRDAVKIMWEEPATQRVFDDAIAHLPAKAGPLRVLDIGCGVGDALRLLCSAPQSQHRTLPAGNVRYTGVDLNEDLLTAARWLHGDTPDMALICDDMRNYAASEFDLCLSTGVPYSHLHPTELEDVLARLFSTARQHVQPTAVVVDVLARYSIEWTSQWQRQRWPYRMSFFATEQAAASTDMTCYSGAELRAVVSAAAERAGCPLDCIDCYDRSILVGRHSTTAEFTPGLRPYRQLVNDLLNPEVEVNYDDLLFDLTLPNAPASITTFFTEYIRDWNMLINHVRELGRSEVSAAHVAGVLQPMLAHGLNRLETRHQRGLGVGHSLMAVAYTRPQ